jgi:hypothetical protein
MTLSSGAVVDQDPVAPNPAPDGGRDSRGRFTKGCKGGPGNPFNRQMAHMRKVLLECISEDDLRQMMQALVLKAKQGDLQALRLVLAYTVGRPGAAVDPDRVDVEEFALFREEAKSPDDFMASIRGMQAGWACDLLRGILPAMTREYCRRAHPLIEPYLPPEQRQDRQPESSPGDAASGVTEREETAPGSEAAPKEQRRATRQRGTREDKGQPRSRPAELTPAELPTVEEILGALRVGPRAALAALQGSGGPAPGEAAGAGPTDYKREETARRCANEEQSGSEGEEGPEKQQRC